MSGINPLDDELSTKIADIDRRLSKLEIASQPQYFIQGSVLANGSESTSTMTSVLASLPSIQTLKNAILLIELVATISGSPSDQNWEIILTQAGHTTIIDNDISPKIRSVSLYQINANLTYTIDFKVANFSGSGTNTASGTLNYIALSG